MTALRKTPVACTTEAAPFVIRSERASDAVAREALLDACFGLNRHARTCQRLRDRRAPDPSCRQLGVGAALIHHSLAAAKRRGHGAVVLLGDAPYYSRFGFSALKTGELSLPGPFERDRLLGLELREGALDGAWGMIAPTGAPAAEKPARCARALRAVPRAA